MKLSAHSLAARVNRLPVEGKYGYDRLLISAVVNSAPRSRAAQSVTVSWAYVHRMNDGSRATAICVRGEVLVSELLRAINNTSVRARVSRVLSEGGAL